MFVLGISLVGGVVDAADADGALVEMALGSADAPLTITEHSSLTCGHCASFHAETLPKIKKAYIDTGKVRLVFRDFPLGKLALIASMLPHCAGPDRYFGFLEVLFRSQRTWAGSNNPLLELTRMARMGGMSEETVNACLNNQALFESIQKRAAEDGEKFDIESTPSFVIDGKTISGNLPFEEFQKVIDAALEKAK
ncbi:MAG: DsbA family protein [Rhodospirillales bacterium]|nr:DsbA family protein [Rhodospirillales bacterium]